MTLYEYVAYKNPNGAKRVINSYGAKAIRRPDILARQLADVVNKNGKEALYRIASVHPDKELLTHLVEFNNKKKAEEETKSCSCEEKSFLSADGQMIKDAVEDLKRSNEKSDSGKSDKTELMIIGAVALIGIALVMKN